MAGGVLKGFGVLFLVLGILLLLAGVGTAIYANQEQEDNEERGLFEDGEETEKNEQMMYAGAGAAGLGIVLSVVSIILFVSGGVRSSNETKRRIDEAGRVGAAAAAAAVVAHQSDASAARATTGALPATPKSQMRGAASASKTAKVDKDAGKTAKGAARRGTTAGASQPNDGAPSKGQRGAVMVGVVLLAVVIGAVIFWAALGGSDGRLSDLVGGGDDEEELGTNRGSGTVGPSLVVMGEQMGADDSVVSLTAPGGTRRIVIEVNWTEAQFGPSVLAVSLEADQNGWTQLTSMVGGPGLVLEAEGDLDGVSLRVDVSPDTSEDGAIPAQDFEVVATYFG